MMQGGWEFVGSAYGITYAALVVYAISLMRRVSAAPHAGPETGLGRAP